LKDYYSLRAQKYEEIYKRDDPVRQDELASLAEAIREAFFDRRVLEVACGTGYWSAVLSSVANHVVAVDASTEMLSIARKKRLPPDKVEFCLGDAYALQSVLGFLIPGWRTSGFLMCLKAGYLNSWRGFTIDWGLGLWSSWRIMSMCPAWAGIL